MAEADEADPGPADAGRAGSEAGDSGLPASTFERYADRLDAAAAVADGAISRDELIACIRRIDAAVAAVEGRGFEPTPFSPQADLAEAIGFGGAELWVKDETHNVSGSHKARHLFTAALAVELGSAAPGDGDSDGPLAIASCGNAALAAAVVAAALQRELEVFVPVWANESVVERIGALGAKVVRVPRRPGVLGDPAHHAMVAAVEAGATAFSCQGTDTPTAIDGGRTIAYEMADQIAAARSGSAGSAASDRSGSGEGGSAEPGHLIDRLFVQVGGGALGCGVVSGFARIAEETDMPVVHVVQPVGNHPLALAWDTLVAELLGTGSPGAAPPAGNARRAAAAAELGAVSAEARREIVRRLHSDPQRWMRPWPEEPASVADGILDDITYDWVPLIEAMLATGGHPIVCPEADLREAHRLGRRHTGIDVSPTGTAGLGGLLTLQREVPDAIGGSERVAVMFTGRLRPGDPLPESD